MAYKRGLLGKLLLAMVFFSFSSQALEISNDTGSIVNLEVRVHPTPSNNPCNANTDVITYSNVLNNMTKKFYDNSAALCSYDIRFSSVKEPAQFVKCPAPLGYSSDYRVVLASLYPVKCYAYPIGCPQR